MAVTRRYLTGGPHLFRGSGGKSYRGSRKRLRRIKWYKDTSVAFWLFVVLLVLMVIVGIPWMIHHPPPEHRGHVGDVRYPS